uniref:Thymidylate_kin domain-containing protein n=1 Tax=Loa loa TaxID=7209 RepID=A0A1I7VPQ3_LOALO
MSSFWWSIYPDFIDRNPGFIGIIRNGITGACRFTSDRSSDLGKFIDRYLKKEVEMEPKEAHLVFAANRQALMPLMVKELLKGTHLVVDRYAYSGIAYTLAKGADNVTMEWAKLADMGELKPDCVIYFNLSFEEAQKRSGFGDERFDSGSFQGKVNDIMEKLAAEDRDLWKVVDASLPIEVISENVWKLVSPILDNVSRRGLAFL